MSYYVSKKDFELYKKRSEDYKNNGYPNCDKKMIPIIDYINTLDGVCAVWCCEGHIEKDNDRWHIVTVVTKDGYTNLFNWYSGLLKNNFKFLFLLRFEIHSSYLIDPIHNDLHPIHELHALCVNKKEKKGFFKIINAYIDTLK